MTLPFSPKKTRSRKVTTVISDEEDDEEDMSLPEITPTRRSSRSTKHARVKLDDEDYEDQLNDSDEFVQGRSTAKVKPVKKKAVRGKASRPAYGHFRSVADLDYDEDEGTAVLRAHRGVCEKCEREPAHKLLQKSKRKKKRKSKKSEDDFEEDENDEDHLVALGGWVRWYVFQGPFLHLEVLTFEAV